MKITVTIPDDDAMLIRLFVAATHDVTASTHGRLDLTKLTALLLEDVATMIRRPGSWEGAGMAAILKSHGYDP